jgi:hypothetical protein
MTFVHWYLLWNLVCIVRGTLTAEIYWDWKNLANNGMALLLPLSAYIAADKHLLSVVFRSYVRNALILFPIVFLIIAARSYGFYLAPVSLLLFFLPVLSQRWKVVLLMCAGVVLLDDLGARSNVIKFAVPILILIFFSVRRFRSIRFLNIFSKLCFVAPLFFLVLAVMGRFNVFQMDEYIRPYQVDNRDNRGHRSSEDLTADTRTFLYIEVLQTAKKYNSWWFGRSPARGNETTAFYDADVTGRGERAANEVAILNVFTWTGIIGVLLYFLVFYRASQLAIRYSNNKYAKMLGLFVAFRWAYSWVEDINNFTLNYLFLWVLIGMCFSKSFREMDDEQLKEWVRSIFKAKSRRSVKMPYLQRTNYLGAHQ